MGLGGAYLAAERGSELMDKREQEVIAQTEKWLRSVVIEHSFCPFAQREFAAGRIRYVVINGQGMANSLHALIEECEKLDQDASIETSLLVYPEAYQRFDDYLDLVAMAEDLLAEQGYEGIYQVASFHPDYCFDGEEESDAANFTNRSPYPVLHLLREASLEAALEAYPGDPTKIPERNIKLAREIGEPALRALFESCFKVNS